METQKQDTVPLGSLEPGDKFEWSGTTFEVRSRGRNNSTYEVPCCTVKEYGGLEYGGFHVKLHSSFRVTKLEKTITVVELSEVRVGETFTWIDTEWVRCRYPENLEERDGRWVTVHPRECSKWHQCLWGETKVMVLR